MEIEDAIDYLKIDISRLGNTRWENLHKEALEMAIEALQRELQIQMEEGVAPVYEEEV